ncbi:MAG: hypothetical protein IT303_01560 [Dehalococcoidia bacterium]|nr:hypothetical protein [Dehalococcoidia bacterium]
MTGFKTSEHLIGDLREIRFWIETGTDTIPGLLIMETDPAGPLPLLFMQHPATSSKDDYFVRDVALRWAQRGWACVGIDAPLHGDRPQHDPLALFRDQSRYPAITAQFADEVTATIDALAAAYPIDTGRLGYVGYSMGSMLGIPAVARDGRFKVAAFCLVGEGGMVGPADGPDVQALGGVAVRIVGKTSDQLIPRAATEALYDGLPGVKDVVWLPGGHFEIGPDVIRAAEEWIKDRL